MEQQHTSHPSTNRGKYFRWKFPGSAYLSAGAIVLVSAIVFLLYPDPFINTFLKGRITEAFRKSYPAYVIRIGSVHCNIRENRIGFDSLALMTVDSTVSCRIASYSLRGIGWFDLLWAQRFVPRGFTGTVLDAQGIVVTFPRKKYEIRCGLLHISAPDSEVVVEALNLHPSGDDNEFFAGSAFRKTRFRLSVPHARVSGLACLDLLQGNTYRARSAHLQDVFLDVLINKDKAAALDTSRPPMPNEIFAAMKKGVAIDTVNFSNAGIMYAERFTLGSTAAVLTLDSMELSVRGIDNRGDARDTAVIRAKGEFMKSAEMNVLMAIPISSREFSFHYSGSLSTMKLNALNPFVGPAEQVRIKSGNLQAGSFAVTVIDGQASGGLRAVYNNLSIAAINKRTGSENGIVDVIASAVANTITIRANNLPGNSGTVKMGTVKYTRQRDDPFFRFVWFALRSAVQDLVGL